MWRGFAFPEALASSPPLLQQLAQETQPHPSCCFPPAVRGIVGISCSPGRPRCCLPHAPRSPRGARSRPNARPPPLKAQAERSTKLQVLARRLRSLCPAPGCDRGRWDRTERSPPAGRCCSGAGCAAAGRRLRPGRCFGAAIPSLRPSVRPFAVPKQQGAAAPLFSSRYCSAQALGPVLPGGKEGSGGRAGHGRCHGGAGCPGDQ